MRTHLMPALLRLCTGLAVAAALPAQATVGGTGTNSFLAVGAYGVQVAPDWVLTANHVAGGFFPVSPPSTTDYSNGYGTRAVVDRFDAPGSGLFPANDVSLLRLAPTLAAVPYLLVSSDLYAVGAMPALNVTITNSGNQLPRGYAFTTVTEFADKIDPDDAGPSGLVTVNYLLSYDSLVHVEGGDSGGGLFLGHVFDAISPLLGLNSARLEDANKVPLGSGFVIPAAYRSWIDSTLSSALNNTQQIQWVSSVPEPGTWLLWAAGLAVLTAVARKRTGPQ